MSSALPARPHGRPRPGGSLRSSPLARLGAPLLAASLAAGCALSAEGTLDGDPLAAGGSGPLAGQGGEGQGGAGQGGAPGPGGAGQAGADAGEGGADAGEGGGSQAGEGGEGGAGGAAGDGEGGAGAAGASGQGGGGEGGESGASGQGGAGGAGGAAECPAGRADCNGDPDDGCEADLGQLKTCGSCDRACATPGGTNATCTKGECSWQCQAGRGDCDGKADNGCEADLGEVAHCGSCGQVCQGTNGVPGCQAGKCEIACAPGFAVCDGAPAQGCVIDLTTDAKNCGACGHDCGGSACEGGLCTPTTVSTGNNRPFQLLVDATHLYWINLGDEQKDANNISYFVNSSVHRLDTLTTTNAQTLATQQPWSYILSQHEGALYVMNLGTQPASFKDGRLWRFDKASLVGKEVRPQVQYGLGMASSADGLFFVESLLKNIFRRNLDGNGENNVSGGSEENITSIASSAGKLFWVRRNKFDESNAAIRRADLGQDKKAKNVTDLATKEAAPDRMWSDADSVYYVNMGDAGRVRRIDQATGVVTTVAEGVSQPQFVTASATHIYWTECGSSPRVMRADKATLTPAVVAQGDCPVGIAVDDRWVYYSAFPKGEIRRVAR